MKKFQSKSFLRSATFAVNGLILAFKSQRNFRKHLYIAFVVLGIALCLKVSVLSFCLLILVNSIVLMLELINSIIEFIMDAYYKNHYSKLVKFAKDMGAGTVLLGAGTSIIIAAIIFGNRIYHIMLQ